MEKVEYCTALPGCCYLCRSSNREWYIDTGQSIDFYGAVYICDECIMEMSTLAGMITPIHADELAARIRFFEEENFDLRVKVSGLEQAIDGLRIAGRISGSDPIGIPHMDSSPESEGSQGTEGQLGTGERTSPEPSNDEGVGELHSDESSSARPSFSLDI